MEDTERLDEQEHEVKSEVDDLERKGDELEERGHEVDRKIAETGEEFDRKKQSSDVPGAQPDD